MAVKFGHASISEKGSINGVKGDSTKKEVCIRNWYNGSWDFMAIHPDPVVREKHAAAVEAACANDNIGYGQGDRNTLNKEAKVVNYDIAKIANPCNCDCSSLQNVAAKASGAKNVTYTSNGWTTRSMRSKLKAAGYIIIDDPAYLTSAMYCVRGVMYVEEGVHTGCGLTNGSKYKHTLAKAGLNKPVETPKPDTPKESSAYTLKDFIKDVQMATGSKVDGIAGPETLSNTITLSAVLNRKHPVIYYVQRRLKALGYTEVGKIDGIAGPKFTAAVEHFQDDNGCVIDGEITARNKTWKKLLGMI